MYTRSFTKMELTFFSRQKLTIVSVMNMHTATKIQIYRLPLPT